MANRLSKRFERKPTAALSILPRPFPYQGALNGSAMHHTHHTPLNWEAAFSGPYYSLSLPLVENADVHVWVVTKIERQKHIFGDAERALVGALRRLGYIVNVSYGPTLPATDVLVIVIGYNVLTKPSLLPPTAIIYQLEQMGDRVTHHPPYSDMLKSHVVWDFSSYNASVLRRDLGCTRVNVCRIGGGSPLSAPTRPKDIDVLFLGIQNPRRKAIVNGLRARGVTVYDGGGWDEERDALIDRARVVLKVHRFDECVLEMVRLSAILPRQAFIVSETGCDPEMERIVDGVVFTPYAQLVDTVVGWLNKPQAERDQRAQRATASFNAFSFADEVKRCLAESVPDFKKKRIKCFVNNRDRLTWTKALIREIERIGGEPIIVDNASTYAPLLAWYATNPCQVIRLESNGGSRAPWNSGVISREVKHGDFYVVTDPDLDLSGVPADALSVLRDGFRHGTFKVGLSLEIEDLPRWALECMQVNNKTLSQIETTYWRDKVDEKFWRAPTDTTFAMYRNFGPMPSDHSFVDAIRADRPYTARHLPWYRSVKDFDDEDRYYTEHRNRQRGYGMWYDSVKST